MERLCHKSYHVVRMQDERPVENLLYGELAEGTRKVGRPFLRLKDTMKDILKRSGIFDIWKRRCKRHARVAEVKGSVSSSMLCTCRLLVGLCCRHFDGP